MINEPWYAVKFLFLHSDLKLRNGKNNFEERIILVKAKNFDDAFNKTEKEAIEYCEELVGVEYLNFCNAYHIAESRIDDLTEIYSLITASDLDQNNYIKNHYDTGGEITKKTNL